MAAQVEEAMGALEEVKAAKGGLETEVLLARMAAAGRCSHSQLPGWGHAEAVWHQRLAPECTSHF